VVIAVSDWDRSIRFYRDVMGAQVVDHPDGRVAFRFGDQQLNVHGPGLDVGTLVASPPVAPGGSDLCFVWPGTMATLARHLAAHGVVVEAGPVMRHGGAGAGNSTYFRDPAGPCWSTSCTPAMSPLMPVPVQAGRSDPACVPSPEGQAAVPDRRVLAPDDAAVLRYQAKPVRAEENQQLIEAVFAELDEGKLEGFTYKVFRLEDGVSFIHVWIEHDVADPDSLRVVSAFQAFMADLADRCDVPPVVTEATLVGGYR
jgi:catechol 2,3-dioxygenase-like lactoylglutathione lyase family enzyme